MGPVFHALLLALGSSWSVSIACRFFIVPEHDSDASVRRTELCREDKQRTSLIVKAHTSLSHLGSATGDEGNVCKEKCLESRAS